MKKGFTLIELMGVLAIIAIIGVIVSTTVYSKIVKSKDNVCRAQEKVIIEAAKLYLTDNPNQNTVASHITIKNLRDGGYLDSDFKKPDNSNYNDETYILVEENSEYKIEYMVDDKKICGKK